MNLFKSYWINSKSPFFSLLFTIPLLVTYEFLIFSLNHSDIVGLRNGADILFRQFFALFNVYGFYLVGFIVLLALFLSFHFHRKKEDTGKFQGKFFLLMFLESFFYALIMFIFLNKIGSLFLSTNGTIGNRQLIALAFGAGVYEEFVFRVVMISAGIFLIKDILGFSKVTATVISVIFASLIFSMFHYIGEYGDVFQIRSFMIRFGAGVFLSALYALRGYGVTAYTHTIYDLIVILL